VIVPSQLVGDAILQRGFATENRVRVVAPGVEPAFFNVDDDAKKRVRARYDLPGKYLLFVGNFEPKKNLPTILRALENLPNVPPLILAGGSRAWKNETRVLAQSVRLRDIGYVARRDLPALYSMCEAFLFPSLAEGFGLPVLEALAAGAPVLASTRVPIPGLSSAALLCEPSDTDAFPSQLQQLLRREKLRDSLRERGPQLAQNFSWRRAARETLQIYREAAS
jgi:glycosyltransferase involved in cell wall biosynthesis